jgi:hypothetical protein
VVEALLQEIREAARATVRARAQAQEDAAVDEEIAAQQHRELMARNAAQVIGGVERARQRRTAVHVNAVAQARIARDRRDTLRLQRQRVEQTLGRLRADLREIEKRRERLTPPDPNDFPTPAEIDAHRQRVDELDREVRRFHAQIQSASVECTRAMEAEDSAQGVLDTAASEEMRARNEL